MKTIVICSGGLDSVSLAHMVAQQHELTRLVSFDYGQRHRKELDYAALCAQRLAVPHDIIDLRAIGAALTGSAIMLTVAFGVAAARGDDAVATAVHGGDHFIYPDCRPAFTQAFDAMQKQALDGYADVSLYTPFVHRTKADIVTEGQRHGAPFDLTWSCYKGGTHHCGRCGTCVERREAFDLAGVSDPTTYEDPDFWAQAVAQKAGA